MTPALRILPPMRFHNHYQRLHPSPFHRFQQHLLDFAARSISREEYLTSCITTVKGTLQSRDYDFSAAGIERTKSLLELFKELTSEASFMTVAEINCLNTDFQGTFSHVMEEKLAADAGKSFYPIPQIYHKSEKVECAQLWTERFFYGLNSLSDIQRNSVLDDAFVTEFTQKTSDQLCDFAHGANNQKFKVMIARMDSDPNSFQRTIEKVAEKAEKDPTSLSCVEKEYVDFMQMYVNYTMRYFPEIEKKIDLLKLCIKIGFTQNQMKVPISESKLLFEEIFKE